jgi:hypothetical protein
MPAVSKIGRGRWHASHGTRSKGAGPQRDSRGMQGSKGQKSGKMYGQMLRACGVASRRVADVAVWSGRNVCTSKLARGRWVIFGVGGPVLGRG